MQQFEDPGVSSWLGNLLYPLQLLLKVQQQGLGETLATLLKGGCCFLWSLFFRVLVPGEKNKAGANDVLLAFQSKWSCQTWDEEGTGYLMGVSFHRFPHL